MLLYTNASPQSLSMLSSNPESPQLGENIESMNEKPTHKCADVKPIFMDHPYAIKDTPIALKRKLDKCSENSQDLRKKIRRRHVQWQGSRYVGFVDIGNGNIDDCS